MGAHRTTLHSGLVPLLAVLLPLGGFAQSPAADAPGPATVAAADEFAPLPDAPSALRSFELPATATPAKVPIELQPHPPIRIRDVPVHMLQDWQHILVSPVYLRRNDLKWLLPLTGAAAAAFATDERTMTQVVSSNPSFNQTSADVSNGLVFGMVALPGSMFGFGKAKHNEHLTEAGILGGEAIGDAIVVDELVKFCAWRERPYVDGGEGRFFVGRAGADSSFVSEHSMVAWSSAAVIAGEYRSKWAKFGIYTAAAGVSLSRVLAQKHFPSDVLLGSSGGWLTGHYVFRAHHHWSQAQLQP